MRVGRDADCEILCTFLNVITLDKSRKGIILDAICCCEKDLEVTWNFLLTVKVFTPIMGRVVYLVSKREEMYGICSISGRLRNAYKILERKREGKREVLT